MASLLILGGVLPLCVALVAQYHFHLPPCKFCMLQRYPYVGAIALGVVSLLSPHMSRLWRLCVVLGAACFLTTGTFGLYHTGIERGWIEYHGGCVTDTAPTASMDDLRSQILGAPTVSCSDTQASFLGLSMASWNSLFAFSVLLLLYLQYRFERTQHARPPTA